MTWKRNFQLRWIFGGRSGQLCSSTCLLLLPEPSKAVTRDKLPPIKPLWQVIVLWSHKMKITCYHPCHHQAHQEVCGCLSIPFLCQLPRTGTWNNYHWTPTTAWVLKIQTCTFRYAVFAAILSWCSLAAESIASCDVSVHPAPLWPIFAPKPSSETFSCP